MNNMKLSPFNLQHPNQSIKSDLHNFGRYVYKLNSGFIYKPRSIFWEWLILGKSPLRAILQSHSDNIFDSLPLLHFNSETFQSGSVEICSATPLDFIQERHLSQTGAVIGLMSFLGITDLHKENIVYGTSGGKYIFAPLDVETVFDNIELPAQTLLVPSKLISWDRCGLSLLIDNFNNHEITCDVLMPLCEGYLSALEFLNQRSIEIVTVLESLIKKYNPSIRRVLRPTKEYYNFNKLETSQQLQLEESEIVQLSRGDIPYYFKNVNSTEVYYYSDPELTKFKSIDPKRIASEETIMNLNFHNFCESIDPRVGSLTSNGLLQLLRLIPSSVKAQVLNFNNLSTEITENEIIVATQSRRLRCRRKQF